MVPPDTTILLQSKSSPNRLHVNRLNRSLKLLKSDIDSLLESEGNKRLSYFPNSPVKKDYVVISDDILNNAKSLGGLVRTSIEFVAERS